MIDHPKDMIFQIPGMISKVETMAHNSIRLKIDSQENLEAEHIERIIKLNNKPGWFTFSVEIIEMDSIIDLPKLDSSKWADGKSPSQRLRAVLYRVHEQKGGSEKDFQAFYMSAMEKIIDHYKNMLE